MKQRAQWKIVIAAVLWGVIGFFATGLAKMGLSPMQRVAVRIVLSAVLYTAVLAVKNPRLLKIKPRDIVYFIGTGVCSLVFFNWCYFSAIELSGLAISAVLLYTAPIFVMLMSALFFREKITVSKTVVILTTFLGCLLVTGTLGGGEKITAAAVLYGLGAGFGYALYSVIGTFALKKYASETVTAYTFLCGAVCVLPISRLWQAGEALCAPATWVYGLGIAVICCILPYLLYTKGLADTPASKAAVLATVEPVTAAVLGIAVYHESATWGKILGIFLVLGSVVWMNIFEGKSKRR